MTKEFIEIQIYHAKYMAENFKGVYSKEYVELADYLSRHPVMQEGEKELKEILDKASNDLVSGLADRFNRMRTNDEQPECEHNYNYSCPKCK